MAKKKNQPKVAARTDKRTPIGSEGRLALAGLMTREQAAADIGIPARRVNEYLHQGLLEGLVVGAVVTKASVKAYIANRDVRGRRSSQAPDR